MFDKKQLQGWSDEDTINFFLNERHAYEALYPSEKYFLTPEFVKSQKSILDIGCAAGGFYSVFKSLNPEVEYTGIDVSQTCLKQAVARHPNANFYPYEGKSIDEIPEISNRKFDLVYCSGLMHLIDNWSDIFIGILSKVNKHLIVDFRLSLKKPSYTGTFIFDFDGDEEFQNSTNYHVLHLNDIMDYFKENQDIAKVSIHGYRGKANRMAYDIDEVYMVFFKIMPGQRVCDQDLIITESPKKFKPFLTNMKGIHHE